MDMVSLLSNSDCLQTYDDADLAISYYISGYASKVICKRLKDTCMSCSVVFIRTEEDELSLDFEHDCNPTLSAKFTENIDRGVLCYPSENVFHVCIICINAFKLMSEGKLMEKLVSDSNPRLLFT